MGARSCCRDRQGLSQAEGLARALLLGDGQVVSRKTEEWVFPVFFKTQRTSGFSLPVSPLLHAWHHLLCVLGQYLIPLFSCWGSAVEMSLHPAES